MHSLTSSSWKEKGIILRTNCRWIYDEAESLTAVKKRRFRQTNSIFREKCAHDIQQLDYVLIYKSLIFISNQTVIYNIIPKRSQKQVSLPASPRVICCLVRPERTVLQTTPPWQKYDGARLWSHRCGGHGTPRQLLMSSYLMWWDSELDNIWYTYRYSYVIYIYMYCYIYMLLHHHIQYNIDHIWDNISLAKGRICWGSMSWLLTACCYLSSRFTESKFYSWGILQGLTGTFM